MHEVVYSSVQRRCRSDIKSTKLASSVMLCFVNKEKEYNLYLLLFCFRCWIMISLFFVSSFLSFCLLAKQRGSIATAS